jgi:aminoglycoside phosphotransferase (APT) family kinase protein
MPHRPVGRKLARCPNCGVSLMGLSRAEAIDAFGIRAPPVLAIVETSSVDFPSDPGLVAVALRFGVAPDALLGQGGEAWVYALDDERVLRVLRDGGRQADVLRRMALVEELALSRPVYRLPEVLDVGEIEGRTYAIERRLPGRSMLEELGRIEGAARERLIEAYLDTSASLGDLHLPAHAGFGDLIADDSIVVPTWRAYLEERAARNLTRSTPELRQVDPAGIADGLPDASTPSFVHLDAFAGNFLTDGVRITAVIDIGASSLAGDRRLDPIASTVYLSDPHVTPTATAHDVDVALAWLRTEGLAEWLEPGRRWLAAYWSFEVDDPKAIAWCSDVLLRSQPII